MLNYKNKNLLISASILGLAAAISPLYCEKDYGLPPLEEPSLPVERYAGVKDEPATFERRELVNSSNLEEKIESSQKKLDTDEEYVLSLFEYGSGSPFSLYSPEDIQQLPRRELFTNIYSSMMGDLNELTVGDLIERYAWG